MPDLTLLDLLNSYPGGIAALSGATGVSTHALYRLAAGKHRKRPVRHVRAVAEAMQSHGTSEEDLWTAWQSAVQNREEKRVAS